eukprot:jgi/Tetstr1/464270/TSEL_009073.t1
MPTTAGQRPVAYLNNIIGIPANAKDTAHVALHFSNLGANDHALDEAVRTRTVDNLIHLLIDTIGGRLFHSDVRVVTRRENDSTMDVDTAQRGTAEAPGKGKVAASAKHMHKQPKGRSRSGGTTRNRSRSKPRLSDTHDSGGEWETDDEAESSGSSHQ